MKIFFLSISIGFLILNCQGKETSVDKPALQQQEQKASVQIKKDDKSSASPEKPGANQPPRVTAVDVTPLIVKINDTIKVDVTAVDPDGDSVNLTYKWYKNDDPLPEMSNALLINKDSFKRGDRIHLDIIPDDGKDKGSSGMVKVTISNSPPEITSSANEIRIENKRFIYLVKTFDPDNDPVSYSLKEAPSGMTINPETGLIQWDVPSNFKGRVSVTVYVKDDQGAETAQSFVVEIGN